MKLFVNWRERLIVGSLLLRATPAWLLPAFVSWGLDWAFSSLPVVLAAHILFDGPRWHLYAVYVYLGVAFIFGTWMGGLAEQIFPLLALGVWLLLGFIFPLPSFPEPEGAWGCGVEEVELSGLLRGVAHCVATSIYYPIEPHRHKTEPRQKWVVCGRSALDAWSRLWNVPVRFLEHLLAAETHGALVAPMSKKRKRYPLMLFSHGLGMSRTSLSMLCQAVTAQGFIVVCIEHGDGSAVYSRTSLATKQFTSWRALGSGKHSELLGGSVEDTSELVSMMLSEEGSFESSTTDGQHLGVDGRGEFPASARDRTQRTSTGSSASEAPRDSSTTRASSGSSGANVSNSASPSGVEGAVTRTAGRLGAASVSASARRRIIPEGHRVPPAVEQEMALRNKQLHTRRAEVDIVFSQLKLLNETRGSWINDKIDWGMCVISGYGLGAATALAACIWDSVNSKAQRFHTAILLGPWTDPFLDGELTLLQSSSHPWISQPQKLSAPPSGHAAPGEAGPAVDSDVSSPSPTAKPGPVGNGNSAAPQGALPQSFMVLTTPEQMNKKIVNSAALVKIVMSGEAARCGSNFLGQIDRAKNIDLSDLGFLAPLPLRWLGLSGPRHPSHTSRMVNKIVVNFLARDYRRTFFGPKPGDGSFKTLRPGGQRSVAKVGRRLAGPGKSSDAAGASESDSASAALWEWSGGGGSFSDGTGREDLSSLAPGGSLVGGLRGGVSRMTIQAAAAGREAGKSSIGWNRASVLRALQLVGVPQAYLESISGPMPSGGRIPTTHVSNSRSGPAARTGGAEEERDILEGVVGCADSVDLKIQGPNSSAGVHWCL